MKIVINADFGGFGLSDECARALGAVVEDYDCYSIHHWPDGGDSWDDRNQRTNPKLIELMETKGADWCGDCSADLRVVEIPDDVEWVIQEYDGREWVAEKHREWH